jgi:ATP-binding protein involved in chromosome partitioning
VFVGTSFGTWEVHSKAMPVTESQVLDALRSVIDPDLHRDIVTLGFVKDIQIAGGDIRFKIQLTTPACPVKDLLEQQAYDLVKALPGVESVQIEMTAQVRQRAEEDQDLIPGVKHAIAIASGKGGVGKSTVTLNLAIALAHEGAKVGLLDADVYGPSIPLMMGAMERPETRDGKILPVYKYGVAMMSLGLLLEEGQAVLWRGPMVAGTVKQLLADVAWGELDYLLIDLPPGTGDAPMSLAQLAPLTGVVLVTTPHHVAANIAGKSIALFTRLKVPMMGVVENMAGYVCPSCGEVSQVFAGVSGGALSDQYHIPYLGSIPLDPTISSAGDDGMPALIAYPEREGSISFRSIAKAVAAQASILSLENELADTPRKLEFSPVQG